MNNLKLLIKNSNHILLGAHVQPDGDAIGALVAVAGICKFFHIPYTVLIEEIPSRYNYLVENLNYAQNYDGDFDTFISVDCGDKERLAKDYRELFDKATVTISIDHHHTNTDFAEYNYVDREGSSTCEIVYKIIKSLEVDITEDMAKAIYSGIVYDTGGFMHANTAPSTLNAVAYLMEHFKLNYPQMYYTVLRMKTQQQLKVANIVNKNMYFIKDGLIGLSYVSFEEMNEISAKREDMSSAIYEIKNIENVKIAGFIYPLKQNQYKLSLRSDNPFDVSQVCMKFGGGGHIRASGATLEGDLQSVLTKVQSEIEKLID
ncbi:hypothetical protein AN639_11890 [Candidatus Epulonipiscium fishelsonii]|uniref:Uncharacterized protein n=1 Tax=Candidatus Epulonipiscium fishelsonii TaxID=77094 RepID=A0ACC8XFN6_9FIRM|nr:hypothetical protein AN396_02100 [Epulopiscium sp. SCG-B11WGA-EpuloA1]ONI42867.1 hypothetical protein AN639_11890 [Epulopiscium sp. SCG-B05WGA-EpuloA1]